MHTRIRRWMLIGLLVAAPFVSSGLRAVAAWAQTSSTIATTTVTDTISLADGTTASGTVLISWGAFTTATGVSVPAGTTSATITNGALSVALVPNAGSTPMGSYYTVVFHLSDGTVSRAYWVVPVSQYPVTVSAISTTVLPTAVAMQTVTKSYVDTAIATAITGHPLDDTTPYVLKAGDTMTGALVLPGDPTTTNQAADKHYVDSSVAAVAGGVGQKVSELPAGTQVVAQPVGTDLETNRMNGVEYASQYVTETGANGIANATTSPDCAAGCSVVAEPTYSAAESFTSSAWNSGAGGTHLEDERLGQRSDVYLNPISATRGGEDAGQVIDVSSTRSTASEASATATPGSFALVIRHQGLTGGNNLFPQSIESVPYFKTNFNAISLTGTYNTPGQHIANAEGINCYGVGDCLIGSQFITSASGFRDEADEGTHPLDVSVAEDTVVFAGSCSTGCTPGSTVVTVAVSAGAGTQGEGRFLIDKSPAKVLTAGALVGGVGLIYDAPGAKATFSGTSFPVSIFLATAATIPSQANNMAPGLVTVPIATSGVTAGFATNTSALTGSSGVACVADLPTGSNPENYEMANYTVLDGTHLQMALNKVHAANATIAVGGLCGYGLEQTVDTANGIRQVFPVIGSYSGTGLYYAGGSTSIAGIQGSTSAYLNISLSVAAIARSNGVVTVTTAGNLPVDVNGLTMTVGGVTDASYNGSFAVTTTGPNTLTYTQTGANSTSTGGTVALLTGGYALYPMAEVLGVFNSGTKKVDGQLLLAPNTVPWSTADAVEEPHYFQEKISGDITFIAQTTPRPLTYQQAGIQFNGSASTGLTGWMVNNAVTPSQYLSNGGMHTQPFAAYQALGVWQETMDIEAGEQSVFTVHCKARGCGRWNSGYDLFSLQSSTGYDSAVYQPTASSLTMTMGGAAYGFTPQALTAATVDATTLNATVINAGTINGAVAATSLPVFHASGTAHAGGAVPDPGSVAGTTRYLREDGTWVAPVAAATGPLLPQSTTLLGEYLLSEGSGTVAHDSSGNGNDATLGGGSAVAPVWTATGLDFSQGQAGVSLPAALNGSKTFLFAFYATPLAQHALANNDPYTVLVTSSLGNTGTNIMSSSISAGGTFVPGAYGLSTYTNGTLNNYTPDLYSGFHTLAFVCGTGSGSVDHLYLDGNEVGSYTMQGSTCGAQTSGNMYLGTSNVGPWANGDLDGRLYYAGFWSTQLTSAQINQASLQVTAMEAARGVPTTPVALSVGSPSLNCDGDSITYGLGVATPFCSSLSLTNQPAYTVKDWGIPGITAQAQAASESNRVGQYCSLSSGVQPITILLDGTNDFTGGGTAPNTAQTVWGFYSAQIAALKKAGCKVFVGTMLSRTGTGSGGQTYDADKDAYDALILNQWKSAGADGIIDYAANPLLGADGANANATYFQADGVHPTQTGQNFMATAASNSLNYYLGAKLGNPTVVTAAAYQMLSGDGAVTAAPTAAQALTMPDCTGPSGESYTISNPQSAYAVTVTGRAGQPINGLATAIAVPANGMVTLRDVANPKTVSGCHWVM